MTVTAQFARATGANVSYYVKIDGVRTPFCDSKRSGAFGSVHPIDADCICCYRLDAASFATEPDSGPNGFDLTDENANCASGWGKFGSGKNVKNPAALTYRRLYCADAAELRPSAITAGLWVWVGGLSTWATSQGTVWLEKCERYDGLPNFQAAYSLSCSSYSVSQGHYPRFNIALDDGDARPTIWEVTPALTHIMPLGWNHLGGTFDGAGTAQIYLNGAMITEQTHASLTSILYGGTEHGRLNVGKPYASTLGDWLWGWIDDVALYSTVKPASWFAERYYDGLPCLIPPEQELSMGLNLQTMRVDSSNMTFRFKDIRDPDDTSSTRRSYFGKLTAPARDFGSGVNRAVLRRLDDDDIQLDANATTIPVQYNADFATSGTAYIGCEAFTYTGVATPTQTGFSNNQTIGTFTGVTKGVWPALRGDGSTRGHTYPYPRRLDNLEGENLASMVVTSQPFSLIGREIGLYACVREPTTGNWSDGSLQWAGQIAQEIEYDPATNIWSLGAESLLRLLDRPVCRHLPTANVDLINLSGDKGRKFWIEEHRAEYVVSAETAFEISVESLVSIGSFELTAGYYSLLDLKAAILTLIQDGSNWTDEPNQTHYELFNAEFEQNADGTLTFTITTEAAGIGIEDGAYWTVVPGWGGRGIGYEPCHAWQALGFAPSRYKMVPFRIDEAGDSIFRAEMPSDRPPYYSYHPTHRAYNGETMRVTFNANDPLWEDQGDWSTSVAWFKAKPEKAYGADEEKTVYVDGYVDYTDAGSYVELDLARPLNAMPQSREPGRFIGSQDPMADAQIQQVYIPSVSTVTSPPRGPLAALLFPLLSTGTANYNDATYDKCPEPLAVDFPVELLNVDSVLEMDRLIMSTWADLAARTMYIIDEPTKWSELWQREAQLFGVFLAWDSGVLKCKSIVSPDFHLAEVTVSQAVRAGAASFPVIKQSAALVTNAWKVEADADIVEAKLRYTGDFTDPESYYGLGGESRTLTIKHPGLRTANAFGYGHLTARLMELFVARTALFRGINQQATVPLTPKMRGLIAIGDIVNYTSTRAHPDPLGTGLMTVSALPALVINHAWSPARDQGSAEVLVFASAVIPQPWAAAAVVDSTQTNGGWDNTNKRLHLEALRYGAAGDADDGSAFAVGDFVRVIEATAVSGTSGFDSYGPFEVASAYETDGANLLTLVAGTTMAGWNADSEHVVVCADYTECTANQIARNLFQCSKTDHTLGTTDEPDRWG